jgi:ribokinase
MNLPLTDALTFLGHVSVDTVENINGRNVQPGGAALHAAIAAKTLTENVALASRIGDDYQFMDVLDTFQSSCLKRSVMPSTKFHIRYDESWEAHYLKTNYGVGSKISYKTVPRDRLNPDSLIHLSPLPPRRVDKIMTKIKEASPKTAISVNTWMGYMNEKKNREILRELALRADFFIINDSEAKALASADSLSIALKLLKARILVVTLGEFGAIINTEDGDVQMVPALRFPVEKILDTTGAGDAWCGAFLAAYKLSRDFVKAVTAASVISSIKCTGWGFSKLQNLRFKNVEEIADYIIGIKEGSLQKSLLDYYT